MTKSNTEVEFLTEVLANAIQNFPEDIRPHVEEINAFRMNLLNESDRAVALMAAAFLEEYLAKLISKKMVDNSKVRRDIFAHNGSLGTFSAKIDLAFMFGFISSDIQKDLHLLRKIRNEFAHTAKPLSFTDHRIKSRCDELCCSALRSKKSNPRTNFNRAMMIAAQEIALTLSKATHADEKKNLIDSNATKKGVEKLVQFMKDKGMDPSILENAIN